MTTMHIEWDGSLALGHAEIDAQHETLVGLINRLYALKAAGGGPADLRGLLLELYSYSVQHFRQEEALMDCLEPELRDAHKREHERFVEDLYGMARRAREGDDLINLELFRWLVDWLLDHISVTDRKLTRCLSR